MPLDQETMEFLVKETIEAALKDTRMKLEELAHKYNFKIIVTPPELVAIEPNPHGEIIWYKQKDL